VERVSLTLAALCLGMKKNYKTYITPKESFWKKELKVDQSGEGSTSKQKFCGNYAM
jgi:hypothetical protein